MGLAFSGGSAEGDRQERVKVKLLLQVNALWFEIASARSPESLREHHLTAELGGDFRHIGDSCFLVSDLVERISPEQGAMRETECIQQIEILDAEDAMIAGAFGVADRVEQPANGGDLRRYFAPGR